MTISGYTRRDKQRLTPEILGQYHALIIKSDLAGFEKLLAQYAPYIPEGVKQELIEEFKQYAASSLRWKWQPPSK